MHEFFYNLRSEDREISIQQIFTYFKMFLTMRLIQIFIQSMSFFFFKTSFFYREFYFIRFDIKVIEIIHILFITYFYFICKLHEIN